MPHDMQLFFVGPGDVLASEVSAGRSSAPLLCLMGPRCTSGRVVGMSGASAAAAAAVTRMLR